jgi:hypothetical protein
VTSSDSSGVRHIPVDPEHIGIRLLFPFLAIVGLLVGYNLGALITTSLDKTLSTVCLGIPMAIVVMIALLQFGERIIKPLWGSGRHIELEDDELRLVDRRRRSKGTVSFRRMELTESHTWYFVVPTRRNRVPKGWYCASLHLAQNGDSAIIYTFIDPESAHQIAGFEDYFHRLTSASKTSASSSDDPRQIAHQRRLRQLEDERWLNGAEVDVASFEAIWVMLQKT